MTIGDRIYLLELTMICGNAEVVIIWGRVWGYGWKRVFHRIHVRRWYEEGMQLSGLPDKNERSMAARSRWWWRSRRGRYEWVGGWGGVRRLKYTHKARILKISVGN